MKGSTEIDRRYPDRPMVGVGGVILVDASSRVAGLPSARPAPYGVVLVKRRFEPLAGHWSLPGGMLEIGETLAAGVAREMLEETGLIVEVGLVVEVFDRIVVDEPSRDESERALVGPTFRSGEADVRPGEPRVRYHYVLIDYLCRAVGGVLRAGSDASEVQVADPRNLAGFGVTPLVETVVARALDMESGQLRAGR